MNKKIVSKGFDTKIKNDLIYMARLASTLRNSTDSTRRASVNGHAQYAIPRGCRHIRRGHEGKSRLSLRLGRGGWSSRRASLRTRLETLENCLQPRDGEFSTVRLPSDFS